MPFEYPEEVVYQRAAENQVLYEENGRLRKAAKAAYSNWACGDPIDENMTELGKLLGFETDIP